MKRIFYLIFVSLILTSCIVSKKKFDDMLAQKIKAEGELSDKSKKLDDANASISQLNESLNKLRRDSVNLSQNLQATSKRLRRSQFRI